MNYSMVSNLKRHWLLSGLMAWLACLPGVARADIAVTLPPLAGIVTMLDPGARVFCLLPGNADPHHFSLTPRQADRLQHARLLVRAGRDDSHWGLHTTAPTLDLWPNTDHGWLRPAEVIRVLPLLAARLRRLHPERRDAIDHALEKARRTCLEIQRQWLHVLAPLRADGIIMQHPAWRGMAAEAGVPVHMVMESARHGHEMGPKRLERALRLLRQHPGIRLWGDVRHDNRALLWLSRHGPGRQAVLLDPLGDCATGWLHLMRRNIARLQSS